MAAHYFIGCHVQKLPESFRKRSGDNRKQSVIDAGYSLAVTHNITQTSMPTADKNDQATSDL
jgi:hypothetical protein